MKLLHGLCTHRRLFISAPESLASHCVLRVLLLSIRASRETNEASNRSHSLKTTATGLTARGCWLRILADYSHWPHWDKLFTTAGKRLTAPCGVVDTLLTPARSQRKAGGRGLRPSEGGHPSVSVLFCSLLWKKFPLNVGKRLVNSRLMLASVTALPLEYPFRCDCHRLSMGAPG